MTRRAAAVFGPTPVAPGILSEASPLRAIKSGNLRRLHAIAFAHLSWANPRHLTGFDRLQDGRLGGGQLIGIPIAGGDKNRAAAFLFGNGRRQKMIGLVGGRLSNGKAARGDELGEDG